MKTEAGRRLRWLAVCLLAAAPAARAADDIAADWRELLSKGDREAIAQTYNLMNELRGDSGAVDKARCREKAGATEAALQVNRVGLALWLVAQDCARAEGEEALAEQRQQRFETLLKHALRGRAVLQGQVPIKVLAVSDAEAVALATGQEILYRSYAPYDGGRYLTLTLGLWDAKNQRETVLEFDHLDAIVQLHRDLPAAEFPSFRNEWARGLIEAAVRNTPDSILALLQAQQDLESGEQEKADSGLRRILELAQAGDMMAATLLSTICANPEQDCPDQAIDALLPLAEKRYSVALVSLAYVYSTTAKKPKEREAVLALLAQADRRLGNVDGSLRFIGLCEAGQADEKLIAAAFKTVQKAAEAGDLRAGAVLALRRVKDRQALDETDMRRLAAAAEAGMPVVQLYLGLHLLAQDKTEQGHKWMHAAAESGYAQAQKWLGLGYYFGRDGLRVDKAEGLRWLKQAGQGGIGDASAMVGEHYAETGKDLAAFKRAEGWLHSGVMQGDWGALVYLAQLYEREIEGLGGGPAKAAKFYELVIAKEDDSNARRGLARLLGWGVGVEKDVLRAERLLRPDAQRGDAKSQFQLGELLQQRDRGLAELFEGVKWLRSSADSGNVAAKVKLAEALWWGRGTAPDPEAARALWRELMSTTEDFPGVYNSFAWAHCTPRDPALLDAAAGLAAIQKIIARADVEWFHIGTLAACQAASGDFAGALVSQKRAIAELEAEEKPEARDIEEARADLKRYEAGKRNDLGEY